MAASPQDMHGREGSVPVPDPTVLTTAALAGAIAALKELFMTRLDAMEGTITSLSAKVIQCAVDTERQVNTLKELHESRLNDASQARHQIQTIIETRLDGMDKAIKLLQDTADKFPARIDEKILSLREVHQEKFVGIDKQFSERDVRVDQSATQTKTAVDAALQAAKEANGKQYESFTASIAKSEASTMKQMDQQAEQTRTKTAAIDAQIGDMKERLTRIEGEGRGSEKAHTFTQSSSGLIIGAIGAAVAAAALLFAFSQRPSAVVYEPPVPALRAAPEK